MSGRPNPDERANELRKQLSVLSDVNSLLDHTFEYYIWFRGHSHRLGRRRHHEVDAAVAEFVIASGAGHAGDQDCVYVFREFELWLTLSVTDWKRRGERVFRSFNHWLQASEVFSVSFDSPEDDQDSTLDT